MKHQWVNPGDLHVYRVCSQCGYRIPVSRDVDPIVEMSADNCPGRGEPVLYSIEPGHLAGLRAVAKRLYTENRMNGDDMRDAAHTIMTVVRFAESLHALRGPGEPYVHVYPKDGP